MSDKKLRELERRFAETGAAADREAWIQERVRVGEVALDPQVIHDKLELLKQRDPHCHVFGARGHGYQLDPCLSSDQVGSVEEHLGLSLPLDYRTFVLEVGSGGAGPGYGLLRLCADDEGPYIGQRDSWETSVLRLTEDFPYTESWNLPSTFWDRQPESFDPPEDEDAWNALVGEIYYGNEHSAGAIPVSDAGCALRQWLVLRGSEAGHIWCDLRADNQGLQPLATKGRTRVTFSEWYVDWLDEAIGDAEQRQTGSPPPVDSFLPRPSPLGNPPSA